ncbi:LysR family transcriptional regulator [Nitratireductor basaltis]|uniref:LysR family transcriptional regulator n=2 Tax=Nitratireductor basaltis TaxID=472175 RepID=A0A084UCZ0_9HYPH|nr:LysR family transcriptional regulator [Nitratireductor basaltis]
MQYFAALADTLHFGRAAENAGVTQPALSSQIAEMEQQLGVRLFERGSGRVILTDDAQRIKPRIERILAEVRELEQSARRREAVLEGRFRLGLIPTVAPYLLPILLPALKTRFPDLRLEVREAVTQTLVDELNSGSLDGIVIAEPMALASLVQADLFEDTFLLAVPQGEAARLSPPIMEEEMALERLMLLEEGHCLRSQALDICRRMKTTVSTDFGATSLATLLQLVSNGLGVTLIPEIARPAAEAMAGIAVLPFAPPRPYRMLNLAWRKSSGRQGDFDALAELLRSLRPVGASTDDLHGKNDPHDRQNQKAQPE